MCLIKDGVRKIEVDWEYIEIIVKKHAEKYRLYYFNKSFDKLFSNSNVYFEMQMTE